jgi:hypothetical protein
MAAAVLVGLAFVAQHYLVRGHLPRPFNADPSQSLMDFYNTAFWANRPGAYNAWHTVYPPLSFLFSRLVTHHACYAGAADHARTCDPIAAWVIVGFYLVNIVLVALALRRSKVTVAVPRTLALCFGLPMLYGLELANLIIPCFSFFVLAEGGLLRFRWARHLCRGLAFNFKLYLLILGLPALIRGRIRWLIGVGGACLLVYLVTFLIYGSGTPRELIADLFFYAHGQSKLFGDENHLGAIAAQSQDLWSHTLPAVLRMGECIALVGILTGALSKRAVDSRRLSALALSLVCAEAALHTQGYSADYTQIFLIFMLFLETEWDPASSFVTLSAYLLCISFDHTLVHAESIVRRSFFSGRLVQVDFDLTLSQFIRPLLVVFIQGGLTCMVLREGFGRAERRPAGQVNLQESLDPL